MRSAHVRVRQSGMLHTQPLHIRGTSTYGHDIDRIRRVRGAATRLG
jgi:hypothetical protein